MNVAAGANQGLGKSYLFSSIVRYLTNKYPAGQPEPRVSVAYYYIQKKDRDDEGSINLALKALVWQLTESDVGYRKVVVAGALGEYEGIDSTMNVWERIVKDLSSKPDATLFILLDGVDNRKREA